MKMKIFSVFDSKVGLYGQPFFSVSCGAAERSFEDILLKKDGNVYAAHPADFTLFELGEWNDEEASVEMLDTPHSLGVGIEFIPRE